MHVPDCWQVIRNRWGTILLTFLLVCSAALIMSLLGKKRVGRVTIQIHHDSQFTVFNEDATAPTGNWLETESAKITSRENFIRVVHAMDLTQRWSLGNDIQSAVDKLGTMVKAKANLQHDTKFIVIEAYSPSPQEAADIANAVAKAYEDHRKEIYKINRDSALATLENELENQTKKVEEKRIIFINIMKQYAIIEAGRGPLMFNGLTGSVANGDDVGKLKAQLKALTEIKDDERLIEQAFSMGFESTTLKEFYPKYLTAKLELQNATEGGLGSQHPSAKAFRGQMEDIKNILKEAVIAYKSNLNTEIEIAKARLKSRSEGKTNQTDYTMAKREYEKQFALLNEMRERNFKRRIDLEMPRMSVHYYERASPEGQHAKPNTQLFLGVGAFLGIVLGLILAFFPRRALK